MLPVSVWCPLQLEDGHSGRLERTEDLWLKVRKDHAPRLARLSLESRSLQDVLLHGEDPAGNAFPALSLLPRQQWGAWLDFHCKCQAPTGHLQLGCRPRGAPRGMHGEGKTWIWGLIAGICALQGSPSWAGSWAEASTGWCTCVTAGGDTSPAPSNPSSLQMRSTGTTWRWNFTT